MIQSNQDSSSEQNYTERDGSVLTLVYSDLLAGPRAYMFTHIR